jgi:sugar lactone lactonase YvrE
LVADANAPGIFRCGRTGRWTPAAEGVAKQRTPLRSITAIAVGDGGVVFAADRATGEVYRVEAGKRPEPLSGGSFEIPTGLAFDASGKLLVCDLRLGVVARLPREGGKPEVVARVAAPRAIGVGTSGELVVLSMGPDQLVRVAGDGSTRPLVTGKPFRFPLALARDAQGRRWLVSDGYGRTIWEVDDAGKASRWLQGAPLVRPGSLCVDQAGDVIIADPAAGQIFRATQAKAISPWISDK